MTTTEMMKMMIHSTATMLTVLFICMATSGCATDRWSIKSAEYSSNHDGKEVKVSNTFLLDQRTGDTWMLWPNQTGYNWKALKAEPTVAASPSVGK